MTRRDKALGNVREHRQLVRGFEGIVASGRVGARTRQVRSAANARVAAARRRRASAFSRRRGGAPRVRRPRRRGRRVRADARLVARIARVEKCVVTPNRRGSEKAHRGASAATHLAAVTPVACMAFGGAPSGVRARAKFATTRSTRETRGVECGECAARPSVTSRAERGEKP